MCALVLLTATVGKFGGCWLAARATGLSARDASMVE
jgi:Kef-type K+ transport system membrane component KefB